MTKMADRIFIDTNILIYAAFPQTEFHNECLQELERLTSQEDKELWINNQVIREFIKVATKLEMDGEKLQQREIFYHVRRFLTLCSVVEGTRAILGNLIRFWLEFDIRGIAIHDANIVASMITAGIPTLLSMDKGFKRYTEHINWRIPTAQSSA